MFTNDSEINCADDIPAHLPTFLTLEIITSDNQSQIKIQTKTRAALSNTCPLTSNRFPWLEVSVKPFSTSDLLSCCCTLLSEGSRSERKKRARGIRWHPISSAAEEIFLRNVWRAPFFNFTRLCQDSHAMAGKKQLVLPEKNSKCHSRHTDSPFCF